MTRPFTVSELKARLMKPALTSHYICSFNPPKSVNDWLQTRSGGLAGIGGETTTFSGEDYYGSQQLIQLSCCDASLPGSSLMTNDITDDYTGVSEKHAYRRLYDDRSDFTFYVDSNYKIISFFEGWISYIVGEEGAEGRLYDLNYCYRASFPNTYKTQALSISKFERDSGRFDVGRTLVYKFINAFPISITSMPVNYDQSQLLKCTVSFTYERYVINKKAGYVTPDNGTFFPGELTVYGADQKPITKTIDINRSTLANYYDNVPVTQFEGNSDAFRAANPGLFPR